MVAQETRSRSSRNGGNTARAKELVGEYPAASVAVLFGVGVGVGLMLGHTIAESTGHHMFHQDTLTEKLTCQIRDALKKSLPEGILRYVS